MGANFNLSVKTFMPWNTKMYNYGRLRRALQASLSLYSSLSLHPSKPAYSLHFPNTNKTDTTYDPFHTSFLATPSCSQRLPRLASLVYRKNLHKVRINYAVKKSYNTILTVQHGVGEENRVLLSAQHLPCLCACPTPAPLLLPLLLLLSGVCVCLGRM